MGEDTPDLDFSPSPTATLASASTATTGAAIPSKTPMHVLVKEIYDMVPIEGEEEAEAEAEAEAGDSFDEMRASTAGGGAESNVASKIIDRMVSNDSAGNKSGSGDQVLD